jgi:hypothetical protein
VTENPEPLMSPELLESPVEPAEGPVEPAVAKKPVRRGRVAAIAGSALLVVAVLGGVGYTVVTVNGADRDAGAPVWKFPKTRAADTKKTTATGLAGALVPYGSDGWGRGPDLGEYGSDAQLSGAEATALRKQSLRELPRTQRKRLEKQIDEQRTKGMAMRSYLSTTETSSVYTDQASTVSIVLAQMEDKAAVRDISRFQNEFLDALGVFRAGPKIEGHKNAECFLPPKDSKEKLDSMYCSAYQGDVLVTLTADSVKPMQTFGVAKLLQEQLDRIKDPGEAV